MAQKVYLLFILSFTFLCMGFAIKDDNLQGFLKPEKKQKKLFRLPLSVETNQVKSPKEIFDFLSTSQTYVKKQFFNEEPDLDYSSISQFSSIGTKTSSKNKMTKPIHLYNFKNTQYTGLISIGSEENQFKVIMDTGSANMWINSARCSDPGCKAHKQYNSGESKHFQKLGYSLDVMFGTGELNGEVNSDDVYLGGLQVEQQDFAEILKETGQVFADSGFDGIVGLAYPSMAAYNFNPIFDNIIKQERLENNQFAFYLSAQEGASESIITFGGFDDNLIDGQIKFHSVIDKYYWMIKADQILVGGKDVGFCPKGCKVIADTGTSLVTGPTDDLLRLLDLADVDDHCKNIQDLPTIEFIIDGVSYPLNPEDYVMQMFDNGVESPLSQASTSSFVETGSQSCIGAFMPLDIPEPQGPAWILGDVFLTKYVSVYDRDINAVGFGKAKH